MPVAPQPFRRRQRHATLTDWQYEESTINGVTILHGFREDHPAALPLISAQGPTRTTAFQRFGIQAREWDRRAGLTHHRRRPSDVA
jgi:hypothetical protein